MIILNGNAKRDWKIKKIRGKLEYKVSQDINVIQMCKRYYKLSDTMNVTIINQINDKIG